MPLVFFRVFPGAINDNPPILEFQVLCNPLIGRHRDNLSCFNPFPTKSK